jgi:hypothetical protein
VSSVTNSDVSVAHNPHLPCELQGGHSWNSPELGEDVLGNKIKLQTCVNCGKVRSGNE